MTEDDIDALGLAARLSQAYVRGIALRPVFPGDQALASLAAFDETWPNGPSPAAETIRLLDGAGSPATVATTGSRYFGFVTGGALPAALAADWMVSVWDQPAPLPILSPAVAAIEAVAGRWVLEALDLPRSAAVAFPTGASYGNLIALAAARRAVLLRQNYDVDELGLRGAPPFRVIVSDEVHSTLIKGVGVLGIGRAALEIVPTDDQGRLRIDALPTLDPTCIVCVQAGNVNSGAFDPIADIAAKTKAAGAWLHVDGAFGLWARAAPRLAHLAAGIEHADSWVTDGHKWLNTPYDCGIVICRDPHMLQGAMSISAAYMPEGETIPAKDRLIEFSRRARGVTVWAAMRALGRQGLSDLIDTCCQHAGTLRAGLSNMGWTIHNDVVLNQVVASYGGAQRTERIRAAIASAGICWFGPTRWRGHDAIRLSVSSWATSAADIAATLDAIAAAVASTAE
jgi:glutamate/tyrosine decarboxylase-like PLP-dependent enzyme